jgi:hypothetical protein
MEHLTLYLLTAYPLEAWPLGDFPKAEDSNLVLEYGGRTAKTILRGKQGTNQSKKERVIRPRRKAEGQGVLPES